MKEVLDFMGNHPWLTFFIALICLQAIIAIFKWIAFMVRGQKNRICPKCGYDWKKVKNSKTE